MVLKRKLKVVELYAGTGRSMDAFRSWRKTECGLLVDNNDHAARVYRHNFPKESYLVADLGSLSARELAAKAGGRVDILLGCPPCQGYSDTGLRNGRDARNRHVTRFLEYVRELKPLAIAFENVPLAAAAGRFKILTNGLERIGYQWTAMIANAALWGSCQSRQRLVLVAIKNGSGAPPEFSPPTHGAGRYFSYSKLGLSDVQDDRISMLGVAPATVRVAGLLPQNFLDRVGRKKMPTVGETIDGLPYADSREGTKIGHVSWGHTPKVLARMARVREGGRWSGGSDHYSQTYGRLHRDGLARTITTYFPNPGSGRFWHPVENRALTLREAARIQGFPDSFQFPGEYASYNCVLVGNALDKALASITYKTIRKSLES